MKTQRGMRFAMVAGFLAMVGYCGYAAAQFDEQFDAANNSIGTAEKLDATHWDSTQNAYVVNGTLETGDIDIYAFDALAGDKVTFDIDNGMKSTTTGSVDTYLTILGPQSGGYLDLKENDDSTLATLDPGSISPYDAYIADFGIPADGTYYVAVSTLGNSISTGGNVTITQSNAPGAYTLIVSGLAAPDTGSTNTGSTNTGATSTGAADTGSTDTTTDSTVQQISIDVRPGHRFRMHVHPSWKESIPVVLLSSADFDPMTVDKSSLTFGHTGDEQSLRFCNKRGADLNRDGRPDLICHFENQKADFEPTDTMAHIKGTANGVAFEGEGPLKAIAAKRRDWRHDGDRHGRDDDDHDRGHRGHR